MNRRIRFIGFALALLFLAVFIQLNNIQVIRANSLAHDSRNYRSITSAFNRPRGQIVTADGVLVATTTPSTDRLKWQRSYPHGDLYSDITGYFSYNFGASGIEQQYNDLLRGGERKATSVADYFSDRTITNNITTTIDSRVQATAQNALNDKSNPLRGSIVAMDPRTGEILAMYSNPNFDPNPLASHDDSVAKLAKTTLDKTTDKPLLSHAYQERYAPGSTMKLVTSTAAYEHSPDLTTKVYPTLNSLALPDTTQQLHNFGNSSCGGSIAQLLKVSCNTGFGQMGLDLGAQNMYDTATSFGFGQDVPIDLPRAAQSNFPSVDYFTTRRPFLALSAIGQGDVAATPLQMCMVGAAIANAGVLMKPHVVSTIRDSDGNEVMKYQSSAWRTVMQPATSTSIRDLMVGVVQGGTATRVAIPGVQVAAKTGTAETGIENQDNAWLVAFAPAQAPTVAVAVFVQNAGGDEGSSQFTGGRTAAPIAKQVLQAALSIQENPRR